MKGKRYWLACACVGAAVSGFGQDVGSIGIGYAWQQTSGNKDAFASQYNLSQGVLLENLNLDLRRVLPGSDRFDLQASGFGGDPFQHASIRLVNGDRTWSLKLEYSRREAVFPSPALDLTGQSGLTPSGALANGGEFSISRWNGSVTFDGWKAARLRLDLRDVQRSGDRLFAYYGLGGSYVGRTSLDERAQEAGLSLETRTLPVKLVFEQDIARYVREPRGGVGNDGQPLFGSSPDVLTGYVTPGKDSSSVPTSRVAAVYNDGRVEVVGQGLYRRDRLDASRNDAATYAIGGGQIGQIGYLDAVMGSADTDTKLGDLRVGYAVTPGFTLRVKGHYADVSTDTTLIGQRFLQLSGPGGTLDLPLAISDSGYLDHTDKDIAGEAEFKTGPFALVAGYHDGSREIAFKHGDDYTAESVTRDAKGWNVTASVALGRTLTAQVGWDDSSFEKYVFRTDPETVTRVWGKVTARPVTGLELAAYASHESLDNPASVADVSRPANTLGVSATLTGANGAFASVSVDSLKLTSDTAIAYFAPDLTTGVSHYDTDLLTTTLRGAVPLGRSVRLSGGGLYLTDRGDSLPFTSKAYDLEVEVPGPFKTSLALFGSYWAYDIKSASDQNYDVHRYGISVRRRF